MSEAMPQSQYTSPMQSALLIYCPKRRSPNLRPLQAQGGEGKTALQLVRADIAWVPGSSAHLLTKRGLDLEFPCSPLSQGFSLCWDLFMALPILGLMYDVGFLGCSSFWNPGGMVWQGCASEFG